MNKKMLREKYKSIRDLMPEYIRKEKSGKIAEILLSCREYISGGNIMSFASFGSEPDTYVVNERVLADGKSLYLPVTDLKNKEMTVSRLGSLSELSKSSCGIYEPSDQTPANPDVLDLIIVPAVSFDRFGFRIGYGGGYYDKFFSKYRLRCPKIGIAFSETFSIAPFPKEPHDIPVDRVIYV